MTALVSLLAAGAIAAGPVPRVDSTPPAWVAPGGAVRVEGWTRSGARVTVLAGARTIGRGTAARLGRFAVTARAPGPGRHALSVVTASMRIRVGTLVVRPLVLAAAGDVNFGDGVLPALDTHGLDYPWRSVGPLLRRADIATVNLECTLSTRGSPVPGKTFTFRGPPSVLGAATRHAGIDVVSLANNHSLDYGSDAFADTLRAARAAGIATVGGGASLAAARRPAVLIRGGLRVAFLGYGDINPPSFFATVETPGTAPASTEYIAADVRAAARRADLVVVWFHWGIEKVTTPTARQRELADAAVRAGADVVLGAHPHVLQPVERSGRWLVAWSLGNFVFIPHSPGTERSGILLVELGAGGVRAQRLRPATAGAQPRLAGR